MYKIVICPMDSYLQNLFADRIGGKHYGKGTEIYKFEKIKRAKRAALAANPGAELIDMGVGEPDEMAFPDCVAGPRQGRRQSRQPQLCRQRRTGLQASRRALDEQCLRRRRDRSGHADRSLHRIQSGAVDPARRASSIPATWP